MLMKNITTIQKQVEGRNFDIRKHILEYDDVLNHHRLAIYARRHRILEGSDIHSEILDMIETEVARIVAIAQGDETIVSLESLTHVIDGLNAFTETEGLTTDDFQGVTDF